MALNLVAISRLLQGITKKYEGATLLKDIDYVGDAISHTVASLMPKKVETLPTNELRKSVTLFKEHFDQALHAYDNDLEFEHFYNYFL
jgi:hypothetical protein